jgi:hypothetical protein
MPPEVGKNRAPHNRASGVPKVYPDGLNPGAH